MSTPHLPNFRRDTSDAPEDITNTEGKVLLGHMEDGTDENLDVGT